MKRPPPETLAASGVLALLALVAIVTSRSDAPAYDPYASTDYRAGGYRAWASLLSREGVIIARFVQRPIELDDRIDTLISAQPPLLGADPEARTAGDIGALAAWVRAGGRLVYVGRNAAVAEAENRVLQLPFFLPDVGARGALRGPLAVTVRALHALGTNRMLFVEHVGQTMLSDGNGDIVVRYPFGRGEIVAAVDAVPIRVTLGIAGFALLLALIGSALRGSPPMRLQPAREPTSVEFVNALAALYERTGARAAARAVLVRDALAAAARSAGLGDDVPGDVVAQRIDERRGGDGVRRLAAALDGPITTDADLLASAKLAHIVRRDYLYGGNGDGSRAAFAGRTRTRRRR